MERRPGESHVFANAIVAMVMGVVHLACIASVAINASVDVHRFGGLEGSDPQRIGRLVAWAVTLVWSLAGVVWSPINAWGLLAKRKWARASALAYWGVCGVLCCCLPGAGYAFFSLTRPEVRVLFPTREP